MSFGEDEEILQDFLIEAGEILESLSEQLVDLERRPDDHNLLNAIFRGFHTVKGGAGFLQLDALVECCHMTENLFDILRNGKRSVTSELMDVVLQALDTVNAQFKQVSQRLPPDRAPVALLKQLERLVSCEDLGEASSSPAADTAGEEKPASASDPDGLNLSDQEFEAFMDVLDDPAPENASTATSGSTAPGDGITEAEFEALLDQLHGSGRGPGRADAAADAASSRNTAEEISAAGATQSDDITEDEFEKLLDQLHGTGKAPGLATREETVRSDAVPTDAETDDNISEQEFEQLLDRLHGKGKGPGKPVVATVAQDLPSVVTAQASGKPSSPQSVTAAFGPSGASTGRPAPIVAAPSKPVTEAADPARTAAQATSAQQGENTVRVDTQRLDDIMNMVGELVLVRNRLVRLGVESDSESLSKAVANLDVVTADLQAAVMKTRMQPIRKVFGRFPRLVRDLARNLKKEVALEMLGEETDLDKNLVEALADPLIHLVRNSVDHGIESPDIREANGKPRTGKIVLAAEQEGDHILLSITDDGAGMDPGHLRNVAVNKGLYDAESAARLSDIEAFNLIFAPGFSTKSQISDVSGRGVGMDVVKTKIGQLNGSIEIQSRLGEGTRLLIKVPLTLAIMPTLMVMLGRQCFALPLASVNEIFQLDLGHAHVVDGQECVTIRDKAVPIFHLKRWLVRSPVGQTDNSEAHVVVVSVGTRRVGFVVDQLIGQEEVVIKPLGKMLHGTPGMAGATITGDGTIALILDVPSLLKRYATKR